MTQYKYIINKKGELSIVQKTTLSWDKLDIMYTDKYLYIVVCCQRTEICFIHLQNK